MLMAASTHSCHHLSRPLRPLKLGEGVAASVGDGAQVVAAIHRYLADHPVEAEAAASAQQPIAAVSKIAVA